MIGRLRPRRDCKFIIDEEARWANKLLEDDGFLPLVFKLHVVRHRHEVVESSYVLRN